MESSKDHHLGECSKSFDEGNTSSAKYIKLSRRNTVKEKCRMRNERRKRKRQRRRKKTEKKFETLQESIEQEKLMRLRAEKKVMIYRNMSRSYWERWNWELQKRKEAIASTPGTTRNSCHSAILHEIEPTMLKDPQNVSDSERWIGRGSFGVVKFQLYRGIKVVSKEVLPKTLLEDVEHEATILMKLCHPYLPYLFGVCTKHRPFRLVMQFHGLGCLSYTLSKTLSTDGFQLDGQVWLRLCAQMVEAIRYLHNEAGVLHNDIKGTNILLSQSVSTEPDPELGDEHVRMQVVVIDFGMATLIGENKRLRLTENDKAHYRIKCPHIAPEVIEGEHQLSTQSDIFSLGSVLYKCIDFGCFNKLPAVKSAITSLAGKCHAIDFHSRPKTATILEELQVVSVS